jgi:hypothetical protein
MKVRKIALFKKTKSKEDPTVDPIETAAYEQQYYSPLSRDDNQPGLNRPWKAVKVEFDVTVVLSQCFIVISKTALREAGSKRWVTLFSA